MINEDPIVQEVRQIREEHAARFNFDFQAIVADLKRSAARRHVTHGLDRPGDLLPSGEDLVIVGDVCWPGWTPTTSASSMRLNGVLSAPDGWVARPRCRRSGLRGRVRAR